MVGRKKQPGLDRLAGRPVIAKVRAQYVGGLANVSLGASTYGVAVMVTATDKYLFFDRLDRRYGNVKDELFRLGLDEIVSATSDRLSDERSEYGWKMSTGFLHGPDRVAAS